MKKPFKVAYIVTPKHGELLKAMQRRRWNQKQLAEYLGISQNDISRILKFRSKPPLYRNQPEKMRLFRERLMELTGKTYDSLFPDEVYRDEVMKRACSLSFFVDRDLATLKIEPSSSFEICTSPTIESETAHYVDVISIIKNAVTKRQWQVLEMKYLKSMTLDEVMMKLGCGSRENVRKIEEKALHKLRSHPHILRNLRGEEDIEFNTALGAEAVQSLSRRALSAPNSPKS